MILRLWNMISNRPASSHRVLKLLFWLFLQEQSVTRTSKENTRQIASETIRSEVSASCCCVQDSRYCTTYHKKQYLAKTAGVCEGISSDVFTLAPMQRQSPNTWGILCPQGWVKTLTAKANLTPPHPPTEYYWIHFIPAKKRPPHRKHYRWHPSSHRLTTTPTYPTQNKQKAPHHEYQSISYAFNTVTIFSHQAHQNHYKFFSQMKEEEKNSIPPQIWR